MVPQRQPPAPLAAQRKPILQKLKSTHKQTSTWQHLHQLSTGTLCPHKQMPTWQRLHQLSTATIHPQQQPRQPPSLPMLHLQKINLHNMQTSLMTTACLGWTPRNPTPTTTPNLLHTSLPQKRAMLLRIPHTQAHHKHKKIRSINRSLRSVLRILCNSLLQRSQNLNCRNGTLPE